MRDVLDFRFEVKEPSDDGTFSGQASTFGNQDLVNDVIAPGAFKDTIREHKEANRMPPLLWQHDTRQPIGRWLDIRETKEGLFAKGKLTLGTQQGREAHALLKDNAIDGLSIGFRVPEDGSEVDKHGVRILKRIDLAEISLVTFPANLMARVERVKAALSSGELPEKRDLERTLQQTMGFSRGDARAFISYGYRGLEDRRDPKAIETAEIIQLLRDAAVALRHAPTRQ